MRGFNFIKLQVLLIMLFSLVSLGEETILHSLKDLTVKESFLNPIKLIFSKQIYDGARLEVGLAIGTNTPRQVD